MLCISLSLPTFGFGLNGETHESFFFTQPYSFQRLTRDIALSIAINIIIDIQWPKQKSATLLIRFIVQLEERLAPIRQTNG